MIRRVATTLPMALFLASLAVPSTMADTPPLPATDWQTTHPGGVVVSGVLAPPQIVIATPGTAPWTLPFWLRSFAVLPSPDGRHVLISSAGGNLLSWDGDPDATVLRLYRTPGVEIATVPLRALMRPGAMQQTASHHIWITGYTWSLDGWLFTTPDGQSWHLGTDLVLERR